MFSTRHAFIILLMLLIIVSGCASPRATPAATPSVTSTPGIQAVNIVDLVAQGSITFKVTSGAINELGLDVSNTSGQPVIIEIPAGTYFANVDPKSQDMLVRHKANLSVPAHGQAGIQLQAACANLHRTEPTQGETFTVRRAASQPLLSVLIDKLNSAGVDYPVEQAAIWIVTDDATFDELGMLVEGSRFGAAVVNEAGALRAMMLVDQAGLSIRQHAIWQDRAQLAAKVSDPDLTAWLNDQLATQTVEQATQAVQTATAEALFTPTPPLREITQYASSASASSEFSATDWSAAQATGVRDTSGCNNAPTAWKTLSTTGREWLKLTYEKPVIPSSILIYEVYHPGAVVQVEVLDEAGEAISVYQAAYANLTQCPRTLEIPVKDVDRQVKSVRVTIDQTGHIGRDLIDAVKLVGQGR